MNWLSDVNVWMALALSAHGHHAVATGWLERVQTPSLILFCRSTQQSFLRLVTSAPVLGRYGNEPLSNSDALDAYDAFLRDARIGFRADEPPGLEPIWRRLASRPSASPKLWMDAYLAAFALAGHYRLVTTDRAFRQFPGLDVEVLGSV